MSARLLLPCLLVLMLAKSIVAQEASESRPNALDAYIANGDTSYEWQAKRRWKLAVSRRSLFD